MEIELRNNLNSFLIFSFSRRKFLSEIEYDEVMSVCAMLRVYNPTGHETSGCTPSIESLQPLAHVSAELTQY